MPRSIITSASIPFEVEARLLQELGERLVASPDVALLELIKNASDADAPACRVSLGRKFGKSVLTIADNGAGMTEEDFRTRWMRIAADSRREPFTAKFRRTVTGQKGIGRFAIRYLGAALKLESVSEDSDTGEKRKLEAIFNWRRLDTQSSLRDTAIYYVVSRVSNDHGTGTKLTVSRLKPNLEDVIDKALLSRVLDIVSPISSLDLGRFAKKRAITTISGNREELVSRTDNRQATADPGFQVIFEGFPAMPENNADIGKKVIENSWARLKISLDGDRLTYKVKFKGEATEERLQITYPNHISRGLFGDIAFAPKRKNAFSNLGPDGREVPKWIRKYSGVGVVDNGFRIRPYGFENDDWLMLNFDGTHNRRSWRSSISNQHFPLSPLELARPKISPALNLAGSTQLVGVIGVASRATHDLSQIDLIPSMDREGFLENEAFSEVVDIVRGGLEWLAWLDKKKLLEVEEREAAEARTGLREDIAATIADIEIDPHLAREEKSALIKHYSSLAVRVVEQEDYDKAARQRLEIAAGLGVVAGFMTHEAERLFLTLDEVIERLTVSATTAGERQNLQDIRATREQLDGYIRYTRLYTESLRNTENRQFSALGQIEWVYQSFGPNADSRGIQTSIQCAEDVLVPPVPVAMYSAVLLNLFTNATKAVIALEDGRSEKEILITSWNDSKGHHLTVQDTGVGIPPASQKRIWDPFFSTTSRVNSPLGTGMGLGLSLVRDLVSRHGGKAELGLPSPGFTTCFHVFLPRPTNAH